MSARIVELAEYRASRGKVSARFHHTGCEHGALTERFQFWRGASGRRYVHSIYSLLMCPALPAANYILVRNDGAGPPKVLAIGRAAHDAPSLNLAEIRQRGAILDADEVHVHLLADTPETRATVEYDLRVGQFSDLAAEPKHAMLH